MGIQGCAGLFDSPDRRPASPGLRRRQWYEQYKIIYFTNNVLFIVMVLKEARVNLSAI